MTFIEFCSNKIEAPIEYTTHFLIDCIKVEKLVAIVLKRVIHAVYVFLKIY